MAQMVLRGCLTQPKSGDYLVKCESRSTHNERVLRSVQKSNYTLLPQWALGGNINTKDLIIQWFQENGGKSKGVLGWTQFDNPYRPDTYLDVEQIAWKNVQVFIGQCKGPDGTQVLDVAYLLNTNFPVEEEYEETLIELQDIVGTEFTIDSGNTEHLEIWMSYFEEIDASETEVTAKTQRASELAAQLMGIASGIRHLPEIKLKWFEHLYRNALDETGDQPVFGSISSI